MQKPIAESWVYAKASDSKVRRKFRVAVYAPIEHESGGFVCGVQTSTRVTPFEVAGENPLQALSLSLRFLFSEFEKLERQGWRFFLDESDSEEVNPRELLSLPNWRSESAV